MRYQQKSNLRSLFWVLIFSIPLVSAAQDGNNKLQNDVIQQRIEFIAQQYESSNIDFSNLIEVLTFYHANPMNINTVTGEDLAELNLLTPFQIRNLIQHRVKNGDFLTIYELRNVSGFDYQSIQNILPFIQVLPTQKSTTYNIKRRIYFAKHEVMSLWGKTLEPQLGYQPIDSNSSSSSSYLGDPNRLYLRYRFKFSNQLSFGVTADKDPGEEFFKGSNPNGFDFYSAHLFVADVGKVKQLALGDFHAQFGQGLTFWSGFSYRKTADALNVVRYAKKLSPYASRNENMFLRGAGTTVSLNNFELTAFYSQKNIDANLADADTLNAEERSFTSFQQSGLHRTEGEIADKNAINERIMGANVDWRNNSMKVGARIIESKYGTSFEGNTQLYQKFLLDTNQWLNAGIDANILIKNVNLFGEFSTSSNGGWAYLAGALLQLDDRVAVSVVNRNFQPNYLSVYANSFGERSTNNNEKGTYIGIKADLVTGVVLTAYVDKYDFQWLSYQADAPTSGLDFMARLNWKINRNLEVYSRYRRETKQRNSSEERPINSLIQESKSYLRFHLSYRASEQIKLQSRIELSDVTHDERDAANGFLIYQDLQYKFNNLNTSLTARAALYDIGTYDARIYAYENDVLYYFSVPAYYNKGSRLMIVAHHKFNSHVEIWAKLAQTYFTNQHTIGSGGELIDGPQRTDVRIQARFKF